jgi:hypothetical protein
MYACIRGRIVRFCLLVAALAEIIAARMDEPDGASALGREARSLARAR